MENNIIYPKERKSGVELLKIIGIILVVISHVIQTLQYDNLELIGYNDYFIDLALPTTNVNILILAIFRHSGHLGNSIFFLTTAWFLLESKKANYKKILKMVAEIWIISVLILIPSLIIRGGDIRIDYILRSFFPTICYNNWYATTYIAFCFICPFLNKLMSKLNFKKHIVFTLLFFLTFVIFNSIYIALDELNLIEPTVNLSFWVFLYFVIGLIKKYANKLCSNLLFNILLSSFGLLSLIGIIIFLNYFGLNNPDLEISLLMFNSKDSVFLIIIAFGWLNIFRRFNFQSKIVNYIASMSLLIYIIHENLVFKKYFRPYFWQLTYKTFGYDYILLWTLVFVVGLFLVSALFGYLYKLLLQKHVYNLTDKLYDSVIRIVRK